MSNADENAGAVEKVTPEKCPDSHCWREYNLIPAHDQPWIVESLLPVEGSAILAGPPKARKSYLGLQLATCLAAGKPWLGFRTKLSKVFYLQLDTPRTIWKLRFKRLERKGIVITDAMNERLIFSDSKDAPFPFDILRPKCAEWLRGKCDELKPDVVIVDTLSKVHGGDEDSRNEMERVMNKIRVATLPAALFLIAHERKNSDGNGLTKVRGSSALTAGVDIILNLRKASEQYRQYKLEIKGRETEDATLDLKSLPTFFFEAQPEAHWNRLCEIILLQDFETGRAAARALQVLAAEIGIQATEEACRKRLERLEQGD